MLVLVALKRVGWNTGECGIKETCWKTLQRSKGTGGPAVVMQNRKFGHYIQVSNVRNYIKSPY